MRSERDRPMSKSKSPKSEEYHLVVVETVNRVLLGALKGSHGRLKAAIGEGKAIELIDAIGVSTALTPAPVQGGPLISAPGAPAERMMTQIAQPIPHMLDVAMVPVPCYPCQPLGGYVVDDFHHTIRARYYDIHRSAVEQGEKVISGIERALASAAMAADDEPDPVKADPPTPIVTP